MWTSWKMSKTLAIALLLCCSASGNAATKKPIEDVTTLEPEPTTPKFPTPTTTTTVQPTNPPTTTTTTTTTAKATTTTTTTTTTVVPPTTTTLPPPTTTAAPPKPFPKPAIGKWDTNCTMVTLAAQLNITYDTKDNKTATALYNIPANATVQDWKCDNETEQMSIEWGPNDSVHAFVIGFGKNDTNKQFFIHSILFSIPAEGDSFPNAKENQHIQLAYMGKLFATPLHMSYHCTRKQVFNLTEKVDNDEIDPKGFLTLTNLQFEAFRTDKSAPFSTVKDCDGGDTPDVVPIAVGIALATLIVIVLIAYLIARRRSNARGYTSF